MKYQEKCELLDKQKLTTDIFKYRIIHSKVFVKKISENFHIFRIFMFFTQRKNSIKQFIEFST